MGGRVDMIHKLTHLAQRQGPLMSSLSHIKDRFARSIRFNADVKDDCPYRAQDGNSENIRAIWFK